MMVIMRYPKGHKDAVRARIVTAAAAALRRHGIDGISIPALMQQVGLTHGGFYAHFPNRDSLVAAAVTAAATETADRVFAPATSWDAVAAQYLSAGHVMHPEQGCVIAALGTEAGRQAAPVQRAFADAARGLIALVQARREGHSDLATASPDTLVHAASLVGAVVLARLVDDADLAERLLAATRSS